MYRGRKQERRDQAKERQDEHDSLTLDKKISKAESRRGNSKKELKRLGAKNDKRNT